MMFLKSLPWTGGHDTRLEMAVETADGAPRDSIVSKNGKV
jgi:hypothetical protein